MNFGNPASGGNNTASTATTIHEFVSKWNGGLPIAGNLTVTTLVHKHQPPNGYTQ
ncbi:MAG: hypothetical protein R2779_09260 [Crocinitomicaceae bacterium]